MRFLTNLKQFHKIKKFVDKIFLFKIGGIKIFIKGGKQKCKIDVYSNYISDYINENIQYLFKFWIIFQ